MIVQKEYLSKLKAFGLNSYEAKLWTALLSRGISTAGELSDIANVPRSRSYDVLESLEKKGFIIMKIGKPIKYIAVPPKDVLDRVKTKIIDDAQSQAKIIDELRSTEVLQELTLLHTQGIDLVDPSDLTGSFRGRNNIYTHLDSLIKTANKSIIIMTTAEGFVRKISTFKKSLLKAAEKGVKIKIVAPITKETLLNLGDLKDKVEIKYINKPLGRFCIVDGEDLTFMLLDDNKTHSSYDVAIWVNSSFFTSALENLFNLSWNSLKSVEFEKKK